MSNSRKPFVHLGPVRKWEKVAEVVLPGSRANWSNAWLGSQGVQLCSRSRSIRGDTAAARFAAQCHPVLLPLTRSLVPSISQIYLETSWQGSLRNVSSCIHRRAGEGGDEYKNKQENKLITISSEKKRLCDSRDLYRSRRQQQDALHKIVIQSCYYIPLLKRTVWFCAKMIVRI